MITYSCSWIEQWKMLWWFALYIYIWEGLYMAILPSYIEILIANPGPRLGGLAWAPWSITLGRDGSCWEVKMGDGPMGRKMGITWENIWKYEGTKDLWCTCYFSYTSQCIWLYVMIHLHKHTFVWAPCFFEWVWMSTFDFGWSFWISLWCPFIQVDEFCSAATWYHSTFSGFAPRDTFQRGLKIIDIWRLARNYSILWCVCLDVVRWFGFFTIVGLKLSETGSRESHILF